MEKIEEDNNDNKQQEKNDEPKSARDIVFEQIRAGLAEHHRSFRGLLLSSFAAGMEVGFTLFLVGIIYTLFHETLPKPALDFLMALAYPIGFIFVIIGRSELFTEHTTLAVIPVLNKSASIKSLLQVWGTVYLGNLLGGYLIAAFLAYLGPSMEIISLDAFYVLAHKLVKHNWLIILSGSVLAGWLMGLLSWLVSSAQETISRISIVFLITALIGIGGLQHSIVGSIEVFAGLLVTDIPVYQYFRFQLLATIGNIIGGVVFVSILKYSSIRYSNRRR